MLSVKNQIINQSKVNKYFNELINLDSIQNLADFFNKSKEDVVKELQKFTIVLYYRNGDIKEIKHEFTETASQIKVYHKNRY